MSVCTYDYVFGLCLLMVLLDHVVHPRGLARATFASVVVDGKEWMAIHIEIMRTTLDTCFQHWRAIFRIRANSGQKHPCLRGKV